MDEKQFGDGLTALRAELDRAITQAIENPLQFADNALLSVIENRCAGLAGRARQAKNSAQLESLAWEVRARAGRLKMLLDSASRFYTTCFSGCHLSLSQCEGLAYGMHGEWGVLENPSHLTVDC